MTTFFVPSLATTQLPTMGRNAFGSVPGFSCARSISTDFGCASARAQPTAAIVEIRFTGETSFGSLPTPTVLPQVARQRKKSRQRREDVRREDDRQHRT